MRGNCTPLCVEEVHAVRSAQSWFPPIIKAMLYLLCSQLESPPSKLSVPETHCASTSAPPISPDPSPKTMSAHHCVPLAYTIYARANVGSPIGPNPPNSCWRICSCTPNDPRYPATILSKQCKQCLPLLMALGPPSTQSTLEMMLLWPRHTAVCLMLAEASSKLWLPLKPLMSHTCSQRACMQLMSHTCNQSACMLLMSHTCSQSACMLLMSHTCNQRACRLSRHKTAAGVLGLPSK